MKTKILEGLKAKFPGVSNSILSGLADSKAKTATTEEEATTIVEGVTFQTVLDFQATSVSQTNTANYEKKYNLKDGKPIETPADDKKQDTDKKPKDDEAETPGEKRLREKLEALEAKLAAQDGDKVATTRKKLIEAEAAKAPEHFRGRYGKGLDRMNFKDDDDFNTYFDGVKADIEADIQAAAVKGSVFGRPPSTGGPKGDEKPSPEVAARIAAREADTVTPAIIGLPK